MRFLKPFKEKAIAENPGTWSAPTFLAITPGCRINSTVYWFSVMGNVFYLSKRSAKKDGKFALVCPNSRQHKCHYMAHGALNLILKDVLFFRDRK